MRSLYGLRQSGCVWYQTLVRTFKDLGFGVCTVDHAVFIQRGEEGKVIVGALTGDLLMISESANLLAKVKHRLEKHFEMTDLGEAHWLLGVEIRCNRNNRTLSLSQGAYITTILVRFNLENVTPLTTPMDPSQRLSKAQCPNTQAEFEDMAETPYRELIGSLMYTAVAT